MRSILLILFIIACGAPAVLHARDYGRDELAEFARDRPEAAAILRGIPEVSDFLEKAFRGEFTSVPLDWANEEPQGNAYAENTPNDDNTFILIRVSAKLLGPVDQVAALVYECRNAQNEKKFAQHIRDAYLGGLGKEEFIREILRLEHNKMKETRAFLTPIQYFRDMEIAQTDFYQKMFNTPEGFEDFLVYLRLVKRPDYDVFDMYSKFYDYLTVTPRKRKEELDAQAKLAAEAKAEQERDQSPVPLEKKNMPATP